MYESVTTAAHSDLHDTENHGKLSQTNTRQPQNNIWKKTNKQKKILRSLQSTDVGPA